MRYSRRLFITFTLLPALLSAKPQDQTGPTFIVQATLTRTQSDGNDSAESNKVELQANSQTAQSRIGGPIPVQLPGGATMTQMVGNQLDCLLKPAANGRYLLQITLTHRGLIDEAKASLLPQRMPDIPVFRNIIYAGTLIVAEGQNVQVTGPDLVNNEALRIDITLSAKQPANGSPQTAAGIQQPPIPLRTQFVLTNAQGDRKSNAVYNIPTTSGITTSFRIGSEVPMAANTPTPAGRAFVFQQVGTQFDQIVRPADDGRFTVQQSVTWRSLMTSGQFRTLVGTETLTLRDGEQGHSSLIDKGTGESLPVDVTVTAVK
jgi:hypothetical protein